MPDISKYEFIIESTPQAFSNISKELSLRAYKRIYFKDELFKFFPYGELYVNDKLASIVDRLFFVEGLRFKIKLGAETLNEKQFGYLENEYVWSEGQIVGIEIADQLAGDNALVLTGVQKIYDNRSSRVWPNSKLSDAVRDIVIKDYKIQETNTAGEKKIFITTTSGLDDRYQMYISDRDFIEQSCEHAFDTNNPKSPFYTFINCNGEFYYMSLGDLFSQATVADFELKLADDNAVDLNLIKGIDVLFGGLPVNLENYAVRNFKTSTSGITTFIDKEIKDQYEKLDSNGLFTTQTETVNFQKPVSSINSFGLYEDSDYYNFQAFNNYKYVDTALSYRITIVTNFNPKTVTGKLVNLKIKKDINGELQYSPEFSNKWLIVKSEHFMDLEGAPFTRLTLSRPSVVVDDEHILKSSFQKS